MFYGYLRTFSHSVFVYPSDFYLKTRVRHTFTIAGSYSRCCKVTHRPNGIKGSFACSKAVQFGSRHHWISTHKACQKSSSKTKRHPKFIRAPCRQRNYICFHQAPLHSFPFNHLFLCCSQRDRLEDLIRHMTPERSKIGDCMIFCIDHAEAADEICECIEESMSNPATAISKKIARLYLMSDILHNCTVKVSNASFYRTS